MRLVLLLAACAAPIQVGNYSMNQENWDRDSKELKQRASFELKCPPDQLQLQILAVMFPGTAGDYAKQVGVVGCDHRLVYVRGDYQSGWLLNSSDGLAK